MPMNGTTVEVVASSWIEALGGLSWKYIRSMPPLFCASAGAAAKPRRARRRRTSRIEPRLHLFIPSEAPASMPAGRNVVDRPLPK